MSQVFIATAKKFNKEGQQFDKNGVQNIALVPLAGTSPRNLNFIAGTVAQNEGLKAGTTYVVRALEEEPYINPDTGVTTRSFNFTMIAEIGAMDAFKMLQEGNLGRLVTTIKENVHINEEEKSIINDNVIDKALAV